MYVYEVIDQSFGVVDGRLRTFRERPLNKQGGAGFFLGPEYFFRNTLEPRNCFQGYMEPFFFHKFYNCNFQTIGPDFSFYSGIGPIFFFFLLHPGPGNFFSKKSRFPRLI